MRFPFSPDWEDAALITDTHWKHRPPTGSFECRSEKDDWTMFNLLQEWGRPDRILVHLGDVVFGLNKDATLDQFVSPLNYRSRILLLGNHDKTKQGWYDKWFDQTYKWATVELSVGRVLLTHEPIKEYWLDPRWSDCVLNVHGHFHDNDHRFGEGSYAVENPRYRLLAIERTGLAPVRLGDFVR